VLRTGTAEHLETNGVTTPHNLVAEAAPESQRAATDPGAVDGIPLMAAEESLITAGCRGVRAQAAVEAAAATPVFVGMVHLSSFIEITGRVLQMCTKS